MADIKQALGSASQTVSCTLAGLTSGSARSGAVVDNTSNLFLDAILDLEIELQSGTIGGLAAIRVWFYGSQDGSNYEGSTDEGIDGTNQAVTLDDPTNLHGPFIIFTPTAAKAYRKIISVAQAFGGVLPPKWGFVIDNQTGCPLHATEGNHTKEYRGQYATSS